MRRHLVLFLICCLCGLMITASCAHARPPKPGPNFVWVSPHVAPGGVKVPGHWQYQGPRVADREWIPGHYGPGGQWIDGHWRPLGAPPQPHSVWVPGHHGPGGRWIPGHWK